MRILFKLLLTAIFVMITFKSIQETDVKSRKDVFFIFLKIVLLIFYSVAILR